MPDLSALYFVEAVSRKDHRDLTAAQAFEIGAIAHKSS
jgi:hypothetical protein